MNRSILSDRNTVNGQLFKKLSLFEKPLDNSDQYFTDIKIFSIVVNIFRNDEIYRNYKSQIMYRNCNYIVYMYVNLKYSKNIYSFKKGKSMKADEIKLSTISEKSLQ